MPFYSAADSNPFPQGSNQIFFELALDAMVVITLDGIVADVNPAAVTLLGQSRGCLQQQPVQRVLPLPLNSVDLWAACASGERMETHLTLQRADGQTPVKVVAIAQALPGHHLLICREASPALPPSTALCLAPEEQDGEVTEPNRAEQELQASRAQLRDILDRARASIVSFRAYPNAIWEYDYYSANAEAVFGFTAVEMMAGLWWERIVPEDQGIVLESHQTQVLQGIPIQIEYRFRHGDGSLRWIRSSITSRWDANAGCWRAIAVDTDITDLKQAEAVLRLQAERERMLASITQHIRQSLDLEQILQVTVQEVRQALQCDRVFLFKFCACQQGGVEAEALRPGCPSLLGYRYPTFCQGDCHTSGCLRPAHTHDTHQKTHQMDCATIRALKLGAIAQVVIPILQQESLWGFLVVHQMQARTWQAWEVELLEAITIQVSIALSQASLYNQLQQFSTRLESEVQSRTVELCQALQFEAMLKRITDKVRDSLDESQILQTVVEELAVGLDVEGCDTGIYNSDHTYSTITYEFTRRLVPIQGLTFCIAESTHPTIYHSILFHGKVAHFCDAVPSTYRSDQRQLSILACPILDNHDILGDLWLFRQREAVFTAAEIRLVKQVASQCAIALRQARLYQAAQAQVQELERLNHMKDDFLSTVSHELRTPMANIKMAAQMVEILLQQAGLLRGGDRITQYFHILDAECQREISLINDLLDLSRLEADAEPLVLGYVEMQSWIPAIAEAFESRIANHQQRLILEIPADLPIIQTDLNYLDRILIELLNNACKYTPSKEAIGIQVALLDNCLNLRVFNTGVTIPASELPRIFDKFYRLPNNDPWKHGGTGLGLTLVKRLTERLGGTIVATSHPHQTTFEIRLPLAAPC